MARIDKNASPRHRWLLLAACCVCHMTTGSVSYHVGVLHVALLNTFRNDVISTSWLCSVYSSMPSLIGPVASLIITTYDCRACLILSGVLAFLGASSCFFITNFYLLYPALIVAGIGQGCSLITSYIAIGYNFPRQANLLMGICACGSGLAIFIHPPLLQKLVDHYGLHGALLVLGALSLNTVACGLAVPPSDFEKQRQLSRKHASAGAARTSHSSFRSLSDVLSDFRFLLLLVTSLGFSSALACYYVFVPGFLLRHRFDRLTASFVLSTTGMGSIPSRLLAGVACNDENIDTSTFFFGVHALAAVVTFLVPWTVGSVAAQMVLAVVFGVYTGAVCATYSPFLLELLGVCKVADGVGLYLFTMGVGYMAGPPLAGKLYTLSSNYHHVFYFTASMFAMASAAAMLSTLIKPRELEEEGRDPKTGMWRRTAEVEMSMDIAGAEPAHQATDTLLPFPSEGLDDHRAAHMGEVNGHRAAHMGEVNGHREVNNHRAAHMGEVNGHREVNDHRAAHMGEVNDHRAAHMGEVNDLRAAHMEEVNGRRHSRGNSTLSIDKNPVIVAKGVDERHFAAQLCFHDSSVVLLPGRDEARVVCQQQQEGDVTA